MFSAYKAVATVALGLIAMAAAHAAAPVTDASAGALAERLDRIERMLESRGLLDMLYQIESLQQEIGRLRGEIELQNHALEQARSGQRSLYVDLDQRLQRLEGAAGIGAAPVDSSTDTAAEANPPLETLSPVAPGNEPEDGEAAQSSLTVELVGQKPAAAPVSPAPATIEPPATVAAVSPDASGGGAGPVTAGAAAESDPVRAQDDYQQAFKLLKQSLYDQAIKAFREFLAVHANSEYADNAQYWLGEAYYVTRQYEPALAEYDRLVSQYPESQKLPDALLKIGYSQQELGRLDEAKHTLAEVAQRFPGTTAARLAEDRLASIRGSTQAGSASQ